MTDEPVTERLKSLRLHANLSMDELARELGYKGASSYQRYEDRGTFKKNYLPLDLTQRLEQVLVGRGDPPITSPQVLALSGLGRPDAAPPAAGDADGETGPPMREAAAFSGLATTASIKEMDVRAGAGNPQLLEAEDDGTIAEWAIPQLVLKNRTQAPAQQIRVITVSGDSMEPDLQSGQRVFVDLTDRLPSPPGIFVLWDGFGITIKQLEVIPYSDPPMVRIKSRNPHYETIEVAAQEVTIHGRVIGKLQWT
jgi:hypothetical protein